jgi:hypothetical protein
MSNESSGVPGRSEKAPVVVGRSVFVNDDSGTVWRLHAP